MLPLLLYGLSQSLPTSTHSYRWSLCGGAALSPHTFLRCIAIWHRHFHEVSSRKKNRKSPVVRLDHLSIEKKCFGRRVEFGCRYIDEVAANCHNWESSWVVLEIRSCFQIRLRMSWQLNYSCLGLWCVHRCRQFCVPVEGSMLRMLLLMILWDICWFLGGCRWWDWWTIV